MSMPASPFRESGTCTARIGLCGRGNSVWPRRGTCRWRSRFAKYGAALRTTALFVCVAVAAELVLGFALALVLKDRFRGRAFALTALLVPMMLPPKGRYGAGVFCWFAGQCVGVAVGADQRGDADFCRADHRLHGIGAQASVARRYFWDDQAVMQVAGKLQPCGHLP